MVLFSMNGTENMLPKRLAIEMVKNKHYWFKQLTELANDYNIMLNPVNDK